MRYEVRLGWNDDSVLIGEYDSHKHIQESEIQAAIDDLEKNEPGFIPTGHALEIARSIEAGDLHPYEIGFTRPDKEHYELRIEEIQEEI